MISKSHIDISPWNGHSLGLQRYSLQSILLEFVDRWEIFSITNQFSSSDFYRFFNCSSFSFDQERQSSSWLRFVLIRWIKQFCRLPIELVDLFSHLRQEILEYPSKKSFPLRSVSPWWFDIRSNTWKCLNSETIAMIFCSNIGWRVWDLLPRCSFDEILLLNEQVIILHISSSKWNTNEDNWIDSVICHGKCGKISSNEFAEVERKNRRNRSLFNWLVSFCWLSFIQCSMKITLSNWRRSFFFHHWTFSSLLYRAYIVYAKRTRGSDKLWGGIEWQRINRCCLRPILPTNSVSWEGFIFRENSLSESKFLVRERNGREILLLLQDLNWRRSISARMEQRCTIDSVWSSNENLVFEWFRNVRIFISTSMEQGSSGDPARSSASNRVFRCFHWRRSAAFSGRGVRVRVRFCDQR